MSGRVVVSTPSDNMKQINVILSEGGGCLVWEMEALSDGLIIIIKEWTKMVIYY